MSQVVKMTTSGVIGVAPGPGVLVLKLIQIQNCEVALTENFKICLPKNQTPFSITHGSRL